MMHVMLSRCLRGGNFSVHVGCYFCTTCWPCGTVGADMGAEGLGVKSRLCLSQLCVSDGPWNLPSFCRGEVSAYLGKIRNNVHT